MSHQLINHNPDLKRLRDEGFEVEVRGGYVLTHHIPYVNPSKEIRFGTLVSTLNISAGKTLSPDTHVIYFIGEHPCNKDGSIITAIRHGSANYPLLEGVTANHSFSNKPAAGYADYYAKISRYAEIISAPAKSINKDVTEKTFKVIEDLAEASVFVYPDTNSSRAKINLINAKLAGKKIAIIGLGGTGSYVLDLLAKTPVGEIHLFDADPFHQHNAFRSPGAASTAKLDQGVKKVHYLKEIYSNMHKHIIAHDYLVTETNVNELSVMSDVFICVDRNSVRKMLMSNLLRMNVPLIDVGLGVQTVDDTLIGTVRVTTATSMKSDHLPQRVAMEDREDDDYVTNIQIADLNSLNASLAVIKWKKMNGFYQDLEQEHNCTYTINVAQLETSDSTA